jgi:hypothetical protein
MEIRSNVSLGKVNFRSELIEIVDFVESRNLISYFFEDRFTILNEDFKNLDVFFNVVNLFIKHFIDFFCFFVLSFFLLLVNTEGMLLLESFNSLISIFIEDIDNSFFVSALHPA